jgi:hypothetical protein
VKKLEIFLGADDKEDGFVYAIGISVSFGKVGFGKWAIRTPDWLHRILTPETAWFTIRSTPYAES